MDATQKFQDNMNRPKSNQNNGRSASRGRAPRRRTPSAPRANPFANVGRTINQKFKPSGGRRANSRDSRGTTRTLTLSTSRRSRSGGSRRSRDSSWDGRQRSSSGGRRRQNSKKGMFAELHRGKKGSFSRHQHEHEQHEQPQPHGEYSGDEEQGYSSSSHSRSLNKPSPQTTSTTINTHPWMLLPYLQLAPRTDIWVLFAISSCAAVASISQGLSTTIGTSASDTKFALSTCCISFIISVFVAFGMRYAPLRTILTRGLFNVVHNTNTLGTTASRGQASFLSALNLTPELLLLSILLVFWMASMPIIINGNTTLNNPSTSLAMAGNNIWNTNLYYSVWTSFLLCGYLWVEVTTLQDRRGAFLKKDDAVNAFTKRWTFLGSISIILMATCGGIYTSASCTGELLKSTNYCSRALLGIPLGAIQLLIMVPVGTLYRLSQMNNPGLSLDKRNKGSAACALLSLAIQSVNTALLTSSTGGGPGNASGTLYFGSWFGFLLGLELCLRYLEFYSTTASLDSASAALGSGSVVKGRRTNSLMDDATAYDTEGADSVLELQYGSENGSASARKQLRNSSGHLVLVEDGSASARKQLRNSSGQLVVVEDHDDHSDGIDKIDDVQSFVFLGAEAAAAIAAVPQAAYSVARQSQDTNVTQQTTGQDPVQLHGAIAPSVTAGNSAPSIKRSISRKNAPTPSINNAPTSVRDRAGYIGSGRRPSNSSPTSVRDPVGSINVRSAAPPPRSGINSLKKKTRSDPDGVSRSGSNILKKKTSSNPDGGASVPRAHYDAFGGSVFHNQIKDMDDPPQVGDILSTIPKPPISQLWSVASSLSPLQEGSGEDNSLDTIGGAAPSSQVDNNVRMVQARYAQHQHHNLRGRQQQKSIPSIPTKTKSSNKKSGDATMSKSSRNRSREKKNKSSRSTHISSDGVRGPVSKHSSQSSTATSQQTTPSVPTTMSRCQEADTSVIITDHSEQRGSRRPSRAPDPVGMARVHQQSGSTLSSRGLSAGGIHTVILTVDTDSEIDPPPTISDDEMSPKDDLSGFSALPNKVGGNSKKNKVDAGRGDRQGAPPPPPPPREP